MKRVFIQTVNGYKIYRNEQVVYATPRYEARNSKGERVASSQTLTTLIQAVATLEPEKTEALVVSILVQVDELDLFQKAVRSIDCKVVQIHEKEYSHDTGVFVDVEIYGYTCLYIIGQMAQNLKELV